MLRKVDIAIITAKAEEYEAVRTLLKSGRPCPGTPVEPTPWAWTVGLIPQHNTDKYYSIVLALTHEQTNVSAALASKDTIKTFEPRYVILLGIAGSLKSWVSQGDVVVGEYTWGYEYGRVQETGRPVVRHLFRLPADNRLKTSTAAFSQAVADWSKSIGSKPGTTAEYPKIAFGGIASGDKVLESIEPDICRAILEVDPDLCAVDMESHGTAQAVRQEAEVRSIGFIAIRGISDVPLGVKRRMGRGTSGSQQAVRSQWTQYASKAAAAFAYAFIASHFPYSATNETPEAGTGMSDADGPIRLETSVMARLEESRRNAELADLPFRTTDILLAIVGNSESLCSRCCARLWPEDTGRLARHLCELKLLQVYGDRGLGNRYRTFHWEDLSMIREAQVISAKDGAALATDRHLLLAVIERNSNTVRKLKERLGENDFAELVEAIKAQSENLPLGPTPV